MLINSEKLFDKSILFFYFLTIAAIVFVIGAYFFIVYHYSVNIPFWDDYTHLDVITSIVSSDSITEKFKLFFSFHNEHRIALARLVTLAALALSNDLNFVTLIILGNLSLLGTGALSFLIFDKNSNQDFKRRVTYFFPVVLLLFNLSYFEASIWAVAALSSLAVIFLSFLCVFILSRFAYRGCWWIFLAFLIGVLSACTQGNGLLILYIGVFLLILQKRYVASVYWSIGAAITSFLYFYNYTDLGYRPDYSTELLSALTIYSNYFFTFLGSWSNVPLFFGILFFVLFLVLTVSGLHRRNPALFGFSLFLLLSALSATVSRAGFGAEQALSSRYKIYSLLFFALIYISLFEFLERPWLAKAVRYLTPGVLVYLIVLKLSTVPVAFDEMDARKQLLINGLSTWKRQGRGLTHWDEKSANRILVRAIDKDIYHPPDTDL